MPHHHNYPVSIDRPFQIVVPVFNEEKTLEIVLNYAKEADYLQYIIFVDDASTDSSPEILQRWVSIENINVIRLNANRKKEGAIRAAMETLLKDGELLPFTVLLDADSLIEISEAGSSVYDQLIEAIAHMRQNKLSGLAFQIDATSQTSPNIFSFGAVADYSAMQFDQWLVSRQSQLWVINGPGGLFETRHLLDILRLIVPDFETGDLLITVELMKLHAPIAFYPKISVRTYVPTTLHSYFNQRRRWERGTTKVLWQERSFYLNLFRRPSILAIETLLHLSLYIGLCASMLLYILKPVELKDVASLILFSYIFWLMINLLKGFWLVSTRKHFPFALFSLCAALNGILWMFVTTPARITGFCEAVYSLLKPVRKFVDVAKPFRVDPERLSGNHRSS